MVRSPRSVPPKVVKLDESAEQSVEDDTGAHYRITFRGGKLDPYRIIELYNVSRGPMEQICKKSLRGEKKGHSLKKVFQEIIDAAKRGIEMIDEDEIQDHNEK